jgi:hypothetical protein
MNKFEEVREKIREIEDQYNVSIFPRGLGYGGATLIIRDNDTYEEEKMEP